MQDSWKTPVGKNKLKRSLKENAVGGAKKQNHRICEVKKFSLANFCMRPPSFCCVPCVWHFLISPWLPWLPLFNTISMAANCPFPRWHTIHPVLLTSPPVSHSCSVSARVCLSVSVTISFIRNDSFFASTELSLCSATLSLRTPLHRNVVDSMEFNKNSAVGCEIVSKWDLYPLGWKNDTYSI